MPRSPDPREAGPKPTFDEKPQPHPGIEERMQEAPDYGEDSYKGLGRLKDRVALPHMKPGSAIINVASVQAYQPSAGILDYASTKGAIVTFTKGLAQSLIERGIRVNCVAPGPVWTPLIPQSFSGEHLKKFGENSPMGRPAQILGVTGGKVLA